MSDFGVRQNGNNPAPSLPLKKRRWLKPTTHIEIHKVGCGCSYCLHRLWPVLWLPKIKTATSWTVIALPWFGKRRWYFRTTAPFAWRVRAR